MKNRVYLNVHGFPDFPKLDAAPNTRASKYHPRSFIVQEVKENDKLANEIQDNWFCRQSFHRLVLIPKLNIWKINKVYDLAVLMNFNLRASRKMGSAILHVWVVILTYHSWRLRNQTKNVEPIQSLLMPIDMGSLPRILAVRNIKFKHHQQVIARLDIQKSKKLIIREGINIIVWGEVAHLLHIS